MRAEDIIIDSENKQKWKEDVQFNKVHLWFDSGVTFFILTNIFA